MKESRRITPLRTILRNCLNHIENLETNPSSCYNYEKEFQDLKQFSETLKAQKEFACTEGEKEVNKKKNRYKDILPFNLSRVVLSKYAGIPGSDYINANFIKGASGSPAYIASQGPLPNTVNDFWRMVVECEVQVIVMACNAQESGKHKCENYWVEKEGEEKRFGMVQICLVKASIVCPDFLVRTMRLKYTNDKDVTEERTVCQFHYSAWPDHGVPPLVHPLLDMVRLVRDTQASETLPVLVHCSAGCGRTGTICAIDFVWGLLRAGKLTEEFSLFNLVKDMRKQRVAMVQTKEQYILVHQAVRELFKEQLQVIESHPYENIDFNGVPLIKDVEEPFYETVCLHKEENCDEKQDKSESKEKQDADTKINKIESAPPLPKKKRPNIVFSKQEKEAENLTERNRLSQEDKEKDKGDASISSILSKPKIVKLRALFEKSQVGRERSVLKDKGSHTVSRSHSLGAVRKPLSIELFESQTDKSILPSTSYQSSPLQPVTLKQSKSSSKSVPLITRSKSLKSFSKSFNSSNNNTSASDFPNKRIIKFYPPNYQCSKIDSYDKNESNVRSSAATDIYTITPLRVLENRDSRKNNSTRRSLESLMEDIQPTISWPVTVIDTVKSNQQLYCSSKLKCKESESNKTTDLLGQQLKCLDLKEEVKVKSIVSGIGTRERRNSFRQAVNKSNFKNACKVVLPTYCANLNSEKEKNLNETHFSPEKKNAYKFFDIGESPLMEHHKTKLETNNSESATKACANFLVKNLSNWSSKNTDTVNVSMQNDKTKKNQSMTDFKTQKILPDPTSNSTCDGLDLILVPKNLFLKKLNSEILCEKESNRENFFKPKDQSFLLNCEDSKKESSRGHLHKTISKANVKTNVYSSKGMDETDGFETRFASRLKTGNDIAIISPRPNLNYQEHLICEKNLKTSKVNNECISNSGISNSGFHKIETPRKEFSTVKTFLGEASTSVKKKTSQLQDVLHKDVALSFLNQKNMNNLSYTKVPLPSFRQNEPSSSNDHRYLSNTEGFSVINIDYENIGRKIQKPVKLLSAEKNQKESFDCLPWQTFPSSLKPPKEGVSLEQLSTKSDSLRFSSPSEADLTSEIDVKLPGKPESGERVVRGIHLGDTTKIQNIQFINSEISNQKKAEQTLNLPPEFKNCGLNDLHKLHQNSAKYSRDDFLLEEPTAPPRVKRHASVTIPRNNLSTFSNIKKVSIWVPPESKFKDDMSTNFQVDKNLKNESFDVDLDAVAASMQKGESVLLKNSVWSNKNRANGSNSNSSLPKKRQHYL